LGKEKCLWWNKNYGPWEKKNVCGGIRTTGLGKRKMFVVE